MPSTQLWYEALGLQYILSYVCINYEMNFYGAQKISKPNMNQHRIPGKIYD